jgi:hypothetical protein
MIYISANIAISDTLKLLKTRGVSHPENELIEALQDGSLTSWGLVAMAPPITPHSRSKSPAAARRQLKPAWWHHLNSPLDDVVYFDRRPTKPPTPFRAERVEVRRKLIDKLWPTPPAESAGASKVAFAGNSDEASPKQPDRNRPARERALRIIKELYPAGIPDQATEPNANLCRRVAEKLKQSGLAGLSDDTILRAAERRK